MSILSALLVKRQSVKEGVDYLEQEVLAAILAQVEKIEVRLSPYRSVTELSVC